MGYYVIFTLFLLKKDGHFYVTGPNRSTEPDNARISACDYGGGLNLNARPCAYVRYTVRSAEYSNMQRRTCLEMIRFCFLGHGFLMDMLSLNRVLKSDFRCRRGPGYV